ncbi:MAG TPA: DcaP family trimeric outer membrane transporter [Stellaceae bacterium]|nr:DcaP family trimeric outer membrane transporter [Stellaceae bacterium]
MSTKRTFGTLAAIGGATAVVALLCSVPNARADELSDLRVNNELLQQRLDQLAQAAQMGPGERMYQNMATQKPAPTIAGSFPRSFLIPGTDTSIRVGGNITLITDTFLEGGVANGSPWNTTIGANGAVNSIGVGTTSNAKGSNDWGFSARQSQLIVETRTPTPYGEARSYLSLDFANSTAYNPGGSGPAAIADNLTPRMKYAYGTLGGWLAGQANSNFEDPDANAETIDFGGNVGEPGRVRVAQIRYTMPLNWAWGGALSFSAENPEVEALTSGGICGSDAGIPSACTTGTVTGNPTKPSAPDFTAALYIPQPWGHIDIGGVLRPAMGLSDGKYLSRSYTGGGGAISFDVKPGWLTPKDDILFHFVAGDGLGAYLNNFGNAAIETNYSALTTGATGGACVAAGPAGATTANCVRSKLIQEIGGEIGYQHWWASNLRSTFSFGINEQNGVKSSYLTAAAAAAASRRIETAHANLLWNPVPFVTVGVEYMWGQRWAVAVPTGTPDSNQIQTIIGKFDVAF